MFAVPPSPKSIAASSFDSSHAHSHQHSLQLPKLEAPPSPTLLPLPHSHLLAPLPSPAGGSMSTRHRQALAPPSSSNQGRRRRSSAHPNHHQSGSGFQRNLSSPLPPPHPHPYAHGPIHTAPSFYRTLSSNGSNAGGHGQKQNGYNGHHLSAGNGHAAQNRSHNSHHEQSSHLHASSSGPGGSTANGGMPQQPSSGPGPARTPGGAQYRRASAAHAHAAQMHAAKVRVQGKAGGAGGAGQASDTSQQQQQPSQQQQQSTHILHPTPSHHQQNSGSGSGGPGMSGATGGGPGTRHRGIVSPPPSLPPVHRLSTPPIRSDSPTLPAIHSSGHSAHNAPPPNNTTNSSMPGSPASQAPQAPRLVPVSRRAGASNAAPSGSNSAAPTSSTPGVATPRSIHQPPPSESGSITDNDVTPTPSLAGTPASTVDLSQIPIAFVLQRLHQLAGQFWSNPRSSDVRLIVPMPQNPPNPADEENSASSSHATPGPGTPTNRFPDPSRQDTPGAAGGPGAPRVPAMSYALHRDYLVPQSTLLRTLLCDRLPPGAPELKGCRILPNTSLHGPRPVYVPLPDPESFGVLVHWMYWGDVAAVENALNSGAVSWRGLVANIEYLGLDDRTKRVVGRWWRRWARAEERANRGFDADADTDDDDDLDDDEDDLYSPWGDATAAAAAGGRAPGPPRAPASRRHPGQQAHASGLSVAQPHGPGHAHSHFTHGRSGLDLLATASEREYDADEMSKRLGML